MDIFIGIFIFLLTLRTLLWHLQNWQIREYRFDRLLAHSKTKEGIINIFNLWFFKGILPRPKFTGRIFMIIGVLGILIIIAFVPLVEIIIKTLVHFHHWEYTETASFPQPTTSLSINQTILVFLILNERLIFLFTALAVLISKLPTYISREILFQKAKKVVQSSQNITTIGIAGSYGKSSTKEILAHLLTRGFGTENVLFNPENQNNEVAIARLILKNKLFFKNPSPKYFIVEVGAYRRGEIAKVCRFIQPKISILTGLNAQHIDLFGSQKNIQLAKFEMAEHTSEKVFFNADNALLFEVFEDHKITATKVALSQKILQDIEPKTNKTQFTLYGEKFTLPWPGAFFVDNALLALECARELGIKRTKLPLYLAKLPPLERALTMTKKNDTSILWDTYSANPDGVMKAIEHLSKFKGRKIFIGIPLKELGNTATKVHEKIFKALKEIKAEVYWGKDDFNEIGKPINKTQFHQISPINNKDINRLKKLLKTLKKDDVVLLESKLPESVLNIFR